MKNLIVKQVWNQVKNRLEAFFAQRSGRYSLLLVLAIGQFFLFQNCSRWSGVVALDSSVIEAANVPGTDGQGPLIPVDPKPECLGTEAPIQIDCGDGQHGPYTKKCENSHWVSYGQCEVDYCVHPETQARLAVGEQFELANCGQGREGANKYICRSHLNNELLLSASTCRDVNSNYVCATGESGPAVSCKDIQGYGAHYVGQVPTLCRADRMGFDVLVQSASVLCTALTCDDMDASGNMVSRAIGYERSLACGSGTYGAIKEVCKLADNGLSAVFMRSLEAEANSCLPILCEGNLKIGDVTHQACASDEVGQGFDLKCLDDGNSDGLGALVRLEGGGCSKKVDQCSPQSALAHACAVDPAYAGQLVVGDVYRKVLCDNQGAASEVLDKSACQVLKCDEASKPSTQCDRGFEGQKSYSCILDDHEQPVWVLDSANSHCAVMSCTTDKGEVVKLGGSLMVPSSSREAEGSDDLMKTCETTFTCSFAEGDSLIVMPSLHEVPQSTQCTEVRQCQVGAMRPTESLCPTPQLGSVVERCKSDSNGGANFWVKDYSACHNPEIGVCGEDGDDLETVLKSKKRKNKIEELLGSQKLCGNGLGPIMGSLKNKGKHFGWSCPGTNGGRATECGVKRRHKGACGMAHGDNRLNKPEDSAACADGEVFGMTQVLKGKNLKWEWECRGQGDDDSEDEMFKMKIKCKTN